jgi:hypothetical protein
MSKVIVCTMAILGLAIVLGGIKSSAAVRDLSSNDLAHRGGEIICDVDCGNMATGCSNMVGPCDPTLLTRVCPNNGTVKCNDPTLWRACIVFHWGPGIMCTPTAVYNCVGTFTYNGNCNPILGGPPTVGSCGGAAALAAPCGRTVGTCKD